MINWTRFAERVPPGTWIRCRIEGYESEIGVLIENYPYEEDEAMAERTDWYVTCQAIDFSALCNHPSLRCQWFDSFPEAHILPTSHFLQYLINGVWMTYHEVMSST